MIPWERTTSGKLVWFKSVCNDSLNIVMGQRKHWYRRYLARGDRTAHIRYKEPDTHIKQIVKKNKDAQKKRAGQNLTQGRRKFIQRKSRTLLTPGAHNSTVEGGN